MNQNINCSKINGSQWDKNTLKLIRPDLKLDKQWTNRFGEYLCQEIYTLMGKDVYKPMKKEHYQPDCEIDTNIIEVKDAHSNMQKFQIYIQNH